MSSETKIDPASLTIQKVRRTRAHIFAAFTHAKEESTLKCRENPLSSFTAALDALAPAVCIICGFPASYAEKMTVGGITLAGPLDGQMITIIAKKDLPDNSRPLNIATPLRLIFAPEQAGEATPGEKAVPLPKNLVALIETVVAETKKYVAGERAQGMINFEAGAEEEGEAEGGEA